jgi:hypothetical protein
VTGEAAHNPRATLAAQLAGSVSALLASGDTSAARVAADALSRLLATTDTGPGAPVVDLALERDKRRT